MWFNTNKLVLYYLLLSKVVRFCYYIDNSFIKILDVFSKINSNIKESTSVLVLSLYMCKKVYYYDSCKIL